MSEKVAVGLHTFGGSVAFVAQEMGFEIAAILDARGGKFSRSNSIYARACRRMFGQDVVHVDERRQWAEALVRLREREVDLLFGQPQFGDTKGMRRVIDPSVSQNDDGVSGVSLLGPDGEDFVRLAQELKPRAVVIFGTGRLHSSGRKYVDLLTSQLAGYVWAVVTTNAVLHGVPQDRKITVLVGTRGFYFNSTAPAEIGADDLPTCWPVLVDLFMRNDGSVVDTSDDGREATIMEIDGHQVTHHVVPKKKDSMASQLLWGAAAILGGGQSLYDVYDLDLWPPIIRNRKGPSGGWVPRLDADGKPSVRWEEGASGRPVLRGLMKGQLPVRLHKSLPAPTIYAIERYIHPVANRPLSLREMARLFGLPDDYYLGNYYQPGMKLLASIVPPPVGKWVIADLLRSMDEETSVPPSKPDSFLFDGCAVAALSKRKRIEAGKWASSYDKKKPTDQ